MRALIFILVLMVWVVSLAAAALLGFCTAKVFKAKNRTLSTEEPDEKQKREAEIRRIEEENFLSYDGREQLPPGLSNY